MSIANIPSDKLLEQIANDLFKAVPGESQATESTNNSFGNEQAQTPGTHSWNNGVDPSNRQENFDITEPATSLKDPFQTETGAPLAVSGDGSSPFHKQIPKLASINQDQYVPDQGIKGHTLQDKQTNVPDSNPGNFNLSEPQTSFPDNHVYDGNIPKAVTGDGSFGQNHALFGSPINESAFQDITVPFQSNSWPEIDAAGKLYEDHQAAKYSSQIPLVSTTPSLLFNSESFGVGKDHTSTGATAFGRHFDVHAVRNDFPILQEYVNGRKLVWFDNAATTHKPQAVIDRLAYFYKHENSNIHRAAHELAARATDAYEEARSIVKRFVNAGSVNEIVFTRGTTESINLVAQSWGEQHLQEGDEIIVSNLEHHANIVPWQLLSKKKGFKIRVIPVNDQGELLLDEYRQLLNEKTKLVAFTHVSNALGTVTPAKTIIDLAHQAGAKVLLDGAQSISHLKIDLQYLNPDFFVFSGHKIFGPTGIGVLYGKEEILNSTQPYQGGGNMIQDVTFEKTIFQQAPNRFEAGTGNIADAVGLGAALEYVEKVGIDVIADYEHQLLEYGTKHFQQIPGVQLIGTAREKASVLSFTLKGYSNEEVGKVLNEYGVAVRTGHHCAQPILRRLGHETSVRPSFAFYNTFEEIDLLAKVVYRLATSKKSYY